MARLVAMVAVLAGCVEGLDPGELGPARHVGVVRGQAPLELLPPAVDRNGNLYVVRGAAGLPEIDVFIGGAGGGWIHACAVTEGMDGGVHGWIGATDDDAWLWAGTAIFELDGARGDCERVLERDAATGTRLDFLAVVPHVRETVSAATAVALVRGGDGGVYRALLEVDAGDLRRVWPFEPGGARDVTVRGVGYDRAGDRGVVLVSYDTGAGASHELRFYSSGGRLTALVPVAGDLGDARVAGAIAVGADGLVAAVLDDGRLVRGAGDVAGVAEVPSMTPVGAHAHRGAVHLVGYAGGQPVAARLAATADVVDPVPWALSTDVAARFAAGLAVVDERASRHEYVRWDGARTALGRQPFVTAHDPRDYAVGVTGWLVAGPGYDSGGVEYTAIAHLAVGIEYPE